MEITTENLKIFGLNLDHCKNLKTLTLAVDGQPIDGLPWPARNEVWLEHDGGKWRVIDKPADPGVKNPVRYGGFKDAFRHHMVFVYATGGNAAENAAAWEKARFDAEIFYHDGNGSIDIIPDAAFTLKGYADRSVIIYGNATTNKAWPLLLTDSPVQVNRGSLKVGDRTLNRDDLGVFMIRPRKDSDVASVGVVAATGPKGARTVVSAHYLESGSGYPDLLVLTPEMFANGSKGVVAAGYFGNDWSLEHGEIVWGE